MPELLRMPEIAANTPSAVLASWLLPVGAGFRTHDTIATVETDKAVVDIEAESDGVLVAALVAEGTEVRVGDPIALLAGLGEQVADVDAALTALGASSTSDNDTSHPTPTPTLELESEQQRQRPANSNSNVGVGSGRSDLVAGNSNSNVGVGSGSPDQAAGNSNSNVGVGSGRPDQAAGDSNRNVGVGSGGPDLVAGNSNRNVGVGSGSPDQAARDSNSNVGVGSGRPDQAAGDSNRNVGVGSGGPDLVAGNSNRNVGVGSGSPDQAARDSNSNVGVGSGRPDQAAGDSNRNVGVGSDGPDQAARNANSNVGVGSGGSGLVGGDSNRNVGVGSGRSDVAARDSNSNVGVGRVFASPLARRLAKEAGLAVEQIAGTGPNSRITKRDVDAALGRRDADAALARRDIDAALARRDVDAAIGRRDVDAALGRRDVDAALGRSAADAALGRRAAEPEVVSAAAFTDLPHSRVRRAIAARLLESKQTAPHFYLRGTAKVDALLRLRAELNSDPKVHVSLTDLVVKAVSQAHLRVPEMNVIWTPDAVRSFSTVDIAVAVATERGLVTPVVRSVDSLSITALSRTSHDLIERAHQGALRQQELEGGTITVTNLGMYGTEEFAAIINPPQAAILAVGAVLAEPVVLDGQVVVGSVMRFTLSVDHRPVDGVTAARWMREFLTIMENPVRILA